MILLDTCVISETVRPTPDERVVRWLKQRRSAELLLSSVTVGELVRGCGLLPDGRRKSQLQVWLDDLRATYRERILPLDERAAARWGEVAAECRRSGRALAVFDGLIGAIAWRHGVAVATRNVEDFAHSGVELLDPWHD